MATPPLRNAEALQLGLALLDLVDRGASGIVLLMPWRHGDRYLVTVWEGCQSSRERGESLAAAASAHLQERPPGPCTTCGEPCTYNRARRRWVCKECESERTSAAAQRRRQRRKAP
jgi:hypothetical protein